MNIALHLWAGELMLNIKAFNLLMVMVVALWLPTGSCCAMVSSALAEPAPATGDADSDAPAPCHAPNHSNDPAPENDPAPCHGQGECECPPALTVGCGRAASTPAAVAPPTHQPLPATSAVAAALADLYAPTFPTGRLAIDSGRPEPTGAPTLLQLGCMLTT